MSDVPRLDELHGAGTVLLQITIPAPRVSRVRRAAELLHSEGGYELNAIGIADEEHGAALEVIARLEVCHVGAAIALRVCGDVPRRRTGRARGDSESVARKRAGQRDMGSGIVHNNGAAAGRISGGLADAAGDGCGGQQRRFVTHAGDAGSRSFGLVSGGVNDQKDSGKGSLHGEGEVHIGEVAGIAGERRHVCAVGRILRLRKRAELQGEGRVTRLYRSLKISRAIVGSGINGNRPCG